MDYKKRFGELREAYEIGRLDYPIESIQYICSLVKIGSKVLDLGCGTGIATRQLEESGLRVFGCDSDDKMVEIAKKYKKSNIEYYVADADKLPFYDGEFDMVTAFGAFHWFSDNGSVSEIKRILKNSGLFVVINKNDTGKFRKDYREVVKEIVGRLPASVKRGYNPFGILNREGFSGLQKKVYPITERFTIDAALVLVQSTGTWNHVPKSQCDKVLEKLAKKFSKTAENGIVKRPIDVVVIHGESRDGTPPLSTFPITIK